jgi:hypothetical protein
VIVAFYGPTDTLATKIVVSLFRTGDSDLAAMERWMSDGERDLRDDPVTLERIDALMREWGTTSVAMTDRIIGCPHEEGIDYPEGESCPQCPFWRHRDRWTGEIEH